MSTTTKAGILASYEYLDATVDAIEKLRRAGFEEIKAYTPYPEHHIEHALGYGQSPVRVWTLVGGLTGAATGLAFTSWTNLDWPLIVGGKPHIAVPAFVPIIFEMAVLFGALSTVVGLFILSRIPNVKPAVVYDPEFTAGRYGVYVEATPDRIEEARSIMNAEEPVELREGGVADA